jgi:hypothetical protein
MITIRINQSPLGLSILPKRFLTPQHAGRKVSLNSIHLSTLGKKLFTACN